jgi:hypothetical protein
MAPPKQQQQQGGQDKDFLLRTAQALAILGPRESGGAGFLTRDEGRRFLKDRHGFEIATDDDLVEAPRHPDFQAFLQRLTPDEIEELELAIVSERHSIETWQPARVTIPVPDGGLGELSDPPDEQE